MKTLFTKVTDLSNHTSPLAHLADSLLSHMAPQQTAEAVHCGRSENVGCCGYRKTRFRRHCISSEGKLTTVYYCLSSNSCG